jgi:hypothetical protein
MFESTWSGRGSVDAAIWLEARRMLRAELPEGLRHLDRAAAPARWTGGAHAKTPAPSRDWLKGGFMATLDTPSPERRRAGGDHARREP